MGSRTWGIRVMYVAYVASTLAVATTALVGCGRATGDNASGDGTGTNMTAEQPYEDMGKEETFSAMRATFGTDFLTDHAEGVLGTRWRSRYYADLTIKEGSEQAAEQAIVDLCGKGSDASSRRRPVLDGKNRISESFDKAELLTVYDHLRSGGNTQTVSTTVYIAKVDGRTHVFVFGG